MPGRIANLSLHRGTIIRDMDKSFKFSGEKREKIDLWIRRGTVLSKKFMRNIKGSWTHGQRKVNAFFNNYDTFLSPLETIISE